MVFQFATSFEHKAGAVETVSAILDTDGAWRVGVYFINTIGIAMTWLTSLAVCITRSRRRCS